MSSFPPPQPPPPPHPPGDKTWLGVPVWAYIVAPLLAGFMIWWTLQ